MASTSGDNPILSIVVIFFNMRREAERTLYSLTASNQQGVAVSDYEIIAIDNASSEPLDAAKISALDPTIKYHYFETQSVSPAAAINYGASIARGEFVAVIVDGARMASPGLVGESIRALHLFDNSFAAALSWHLGPDVQNASVNEGYCQAEEDRLLESIDWRNNGYGLFEIATLARPSNAGFLGGIPPECSWFAMQRDTFIDMGGYDEQFQMPGGGLVNHDFVARIVTRGDLTPVMLLGEGVFHQIHGGAATGASSKAEHPWPKFNAEYERIRGCSYARPQMPEPYYLGTMRPEAMKFVNMRAKPGYQA